MKKRVFLTLILLSGIKIFAMTATRIRERVKVDVAALPQCFCVVPCEADARLANGIFQRYKSIYLISNFFPNLKHPRERRLKTVEYLNYLLSLYDDSMSYTDEEKNFGQKIVKSGLHYFLHANKTTGEVSELSFRFGELICKALQGEEKFESILLIGEDYRIFSDRSEEIKQRLLAEGWKVLNSFGVYRQSNSQS